MRNVQNCNVLITGADGFIGSHLTEAVLNSGGRVRALCQYNSFNSQGWLEDIEDKVSLEIVSGDVRDPYFCKKITEGIDTVFHLASLIAIPYSYTAPASYVDTNINGTLNICQGALENGCKRFVHTSTSEVYGTAKYVPIDEKHPLQPQSPYSASKIGADAIAMSYFSSFDLPLVIARPFNTYGPRQSARAVIPSIIIQIASGKNVIKLGDLTPTRDFNYVKDVCRGFMLLAASEALGEAINIGSGHEISIQDTFDKICRIMNSQIECLTDDLRIRPKKSEVFRLCCDNGRINEVTNYSPEYSIDHGLERTIEWFSITKNLTKYKTEIYNV